MVSSSIDAGWPCPAGNSKESSLPRPVRRNSIVRQADPDAYVSPVTHGPCGTERSRGELVGWLARQGVTPPAVHVHELGTPGRWSSGKVRQFASLH
jgi:hypothetical protein